MCQAAALAKGKIFEENAANELERAKKLVK
jgi:hypothetical protein